MAKLWNWGILPLWHQGNEYLSGKCQQKICGPLERVVGLPESNWVDLQILEEPIKQAQKAGEGAEAKVYIRHFPTKNEKV